MYNCLVYVVKIMKVFRNLHMANDTFLHYCKKHTQCICSFYHAIGWTLHFVLGPSLADKNVRIFVNHPAEAHAGPNRDVYRELSWMNMSGIQSDCFDNFAEVILVLSGSFNYYFTINGRSALGLAFYCVMLC